MRHNSWQKTCLPEHNRPMLSLCLHHQHHHQEICNGSSPYSSKPDAACAMRETIQDPRCRVVSVASSQLLGRMVVVTRIQCTVPELFTTARNQRDTTMCFTQSFKNRFPITTHRRGLVSPVGPWRHSSSLSCLFFRILLVRSTRLDGKPSSPPAEFSFLRSEALVFIFVACEILLFEVPSRKVDRGQKHLSSRRLYSTQKQRVKCCWKSTSV